MSKTFVIAAAVCCLFASVVRSDCPEDLPTKEGFELEKYFGDWYCQYAIPAVFQPSGSTCVRAQYGKKSDDDDDDEGEDSKLSSMSVFYSVTNQIGLFTDFCGVAWQADQKEAPAEITQAFPFPPVPSKLLILDTDYETYSAVYSCADRGIFGTTEYGWLMTRKANVSQAVIDKAVKVFKDNNIDFDDKFERVRQHDGCQYDADNSCKDDQFPNNPLSTLLNVLNSLTRIAFRAVNNFP